MPLVEIDTHLLWITAGFSGAPCPEVVLPPLGTTAGGGPDREPWRRGGGERAQAHEASRLRRRSLESAPVSVGESDGLRPGSAELQFPDQQIGGAPEHATTRGATSGCATARGQCSSHSGCAARAATRWACANTDSTDSESDSLEQSSRARASSRSSLSAARPSSGGSPSIERNGCSVCATRWSVRSKQQPGALGPIVQRRDVLAANAGLKLAHPAADEGDVAQPERRKPSDGRVRDVVRVDLVVLLVDGVLHPLGRRGLQRLDEVRGVAHGGPVREVDRSGHSRPTLRSITHLTPRTHTRDAPTRVVRAAQGGHRRD